MRSLKGTKYTNFNFDQKRWLKKQNSHQCSWTHHQNNHYCNYSHMIQLYYCNSHCDHIGGCLRHIHRYLNRMEIKCDGKRQGTSTFIKTERVESYINLVSTFFLKYVTSHLCSQRHLRYNHHDKCNCTVQLYCCNIHLDDSRESHHHTRSHLKKIYSWHNVY